MDELRCRICLTYEKELNNLYDEINSLPITFYDKLIACIPSLIIAKNDPYPNNICRQCSRLLDEFYEFYLLCLRSDRKLREATADHMEKKVETKEEPELSLGELSPEVEINTEPTSTKIGTKRIRRKREDCYNDQGRYIPPVTKRTFECDICGEKVLDKSGIKLHFRRQHQSLHLTEFQYECSICTKRFRTAYNLRRHQIGVHAKPTISCKFCDEKFQTMGALGKHSWRHYHTEQYQCTGCSKAYAQYHGLKIHMKLHHPHMNIPPKKVASEPVLKK